MVSKVKIFGITIDNVSWNQTIKFIGSVIKSPNPLPRYIVTPNVDHIVKLQQDMEFKRAYLNADLVIVDSQYLMWACKLLDQPLKAKIPGSDLLPFICKKAAERGWKIFLLGAGPGVARAAAKTLQEIYPDLPVVGTYSPPYGFEENKDESEKIIKKIKDTKPDILFVGLGAPKQEKWIYRYKDKYQAPVSIGVGAAFDFVSGNIRRAPKWMTDHGLEWFWRFLQEPRRMWKRYFIRDLAFFPLIIREFLKSFENRK